MTVASAATGLKRAVVSDADGRYVVPALPPGRYELRAELAGFKPQIRRDIDLTVNETLSLAVVLEVGAVDLVTEIVVRPQPTVNTSTSELSYLVGAGGDRARCR